MITARQQTILNLIQDHGPTRISWLSEELNVSLETIRRDIRPLSASGRVIKQHGSVRSARHSSDASFERRMDKNIAAKQAIARHVATMISDGDSVMLDTGTTTSCVAQHLLSKRDLTIVTNSSDVARTLATQNGNRVYMAGGELDGDNGAAFGRTAVEFISNFKVDHAIISIAGVDANGELMDFQLYEAEIARMVLSCGRRRMVVSDQSKFNRTALTRVAGFNDIDMLITDGPPPQNIATRLAEASVEVKLV